MRQYQPDRRVGIPIAVLLVVALIAGGIWSVERTLSMRDTGIVTPATVVDVTRNGAKSRSYAPVWSYQFQGRQYRTESNVSTSATVLFGLAAVVIAVSIGALRGTRVS